MQHPVHGCPLDDSQVTNPLSLPVSLTYSNGFPANRHHVIFKDVYREVGLLEVFVTCLQRFAGLMKLKSDATTTTSTGALISLEADAEKKEGTAEPDHEKELGYLVMECLGVLLVGNANNAAVFRESGGARCAHNLIPFTDCRREALCPSFSFNSLEENVTNYRVR